MTGVRQPPWETLLTIIWHTAGDLQLASSNFFLAPIRPWVPKHDLLTQHRRAPVQLLASSQGRCVLARGHRNCNQLESCLIRRTDRMFGAGGRLPEPFGRPKPLRSGPGPPVAIPVSASRAPAPSAPCIAFMIPHVRSVVTGLRNLISEELGLPSWTMEGST